MKVKILVVLSSIFILSLGFLLLSPGAPDTPEFAQYEAGPERKTAFFDFLQPLIQQQNAEISAIREDLQTLYDDRESLSGRQLRKVEQLAENYEMESFDSSVAQQWDDLISRIDTIPVSLALAQAANESAWGTSNFAVQGNNFYGHWCYQPGCGIVPANRDEGAVHEVAAFDSPQESVNKYIANLNSHDAYESLRQIRAELRAKDVAVSGTGLAEGLLNYSERGQEYVKDIKNLIEFNELDRFD